MKPVGLIVALLAGIVSAQVPEPPSEPPARGAAAADAAPAAAASDAPSPATVRAAIGRGVDFLLADQNKDGSWGGPRNKTFTDSFANVQTHHAWAVATTGLACMALAENAPPDRGDAAVTRGLAWVAAHADIKRPADWDIDNVWGYVYGLQAVANIASMERFRGAPERTSWLEAGKTMVDGLARYQSPNGGWGYYADASAAWRPEWATSFTTAAAVLALLDAQDAGIHVPAKVLRAAVEAVRRCRQPTGAYSYSVMVTPRPSLTGIDDIKGSLGRIQIGNLALVRAGVALPAGELERGVGLFFEHHRFLDCALRKPIPHESWYYNAAYFYLFGHYYASQVIARLPQAERARHWPHLQEGILKTQEPDGGFWDFYMSSHTKPYGTSFSILALARSLESAE